MRLGFTDSGVMWQPLARQCCTQLGIYMQGRLPGRWARKCFSWGFPFSLNGCETKVILLGLKSLQLQVTSPNLAKKLPSNEAPLSFKAFIGCS